MIVLENSVDHLHQWAVENLQLTQQDIFYLCYRHDFKEDRNPEHLMDFFDEALTPFTIQSLNFRKDRKQKPFFKSMHS